ncbi:MAG: MlaD family protein [Bacteroidetes bacterium]|nr:MlaD family protein [Bacteroidota bacterium]
MRNTNSQKVKLGIFVVIGTFLLVGALYFIGNRQNLFGNTIQLYGEFNNVNGLQLGNNVRYSGIDVGTISSITMKNDTVILVEMTIKESVRVHIKKDAIATIGSDGLVGNMIVNIIPRKGRLTAVVTGDTINTFSRIGTEDMLTTLNVTNENAALLTADLLKITTEILNGEGALGMLISDTTMANDLKESMVNLRETSASASKGINELRKYVNEVRSGHSVANVLFTDSIYGNKMEQIIVNLETASDDLYKATESASSIFKEVENGKGILKSLTTDETLAREVDSTIINIKQSSQKLNNNMDALKEHFLFRGYFKRQERKEKRDKRKQNKMN